MEQPQLSRAASPRALDELVAQERTRQDARLAVLRRLREEAERVLSAASSTPSSSSPSVGARLRSLLRRRRASAPNHERSLRARYEDAQLRARRAHAFAETLADLARELVLEGERLRGLLADLERDDDALDLHLRRLRSHDVPGDPVERRAQDCEALRDAVRAAQDRLLRLNESERMLLVRVDSLRDEVERSARAASQRLDDMGTTLRSLATQQDSAQVLADLERALSELFGALDDSTRKVRDAGPTS